MIVRIIPNFLGVASLCLFLFNYLNYWFAIPNANYIITLIAVMLIFSPVLLFCNLTEKCTWLANFGRRSLGIMLTHMLMLHTVAVVLNRVFEKGSISWIITFLAAYVLVCFAAYWLTVLIERYCPILLGKK